jgi:signal transduction histidine kinase
MSKTLASTVNGFVGRVYAYFFSHRWLFPLTAAVAVVLIVELEAALKGYLPPSLQTAGEILPDVLTILVVMRIFMASLDNANRERIWAFNQLQGLQDLDYRLERARSWQELTTEIVSFPRSLLPLGGSRLFVFNRECQQYELTAFWGFDELACLQQSLPAEAVKTQESPSNALQVSQAGNCFTPDQVALAGLQCLCLNLVHASAPVGLLQVYIPIGLELGEDHRALLSHAGMRMALALEDAQLMRSSSRYHVEMEKERDQIAHDLHDTLGQDLAYLSLGLQKLARQQTSLTDPLVQRDLQHMQHVTSQASDVVRGTLASLQIRNTQDFIVTVEEYARKVGERSDLATRFTCFGEPYAVSSTPLQQVFSIFRELMANVERHAGATQVEVRLIFAADGLILNVKDDGKGFDPARVKQNGHFGLKIIEEKTRRLNGEVVWQSAPGAGTRVSVNVPGEMLSAGSLS